MHHRCEQRTKGVAHRRALPGAILLCALVFAPPALASRGHAFKEAFSKPCSLEPCEGSLKKPDGIAVNEASGDIYVVDKGANRVARFDEEGKYLGEFNGSGLVEVEGVLIEGEAAGSGGRPGESGGGGELPGERGVATARFEEPEGIAVDNSCAQRQLAEPQCEEEDPSNGDVYVVDTGEHRVIDKYDPQGKYLGQITAAGEESFQEQALLGVAVDAEGVVWVYRAVDQGVIDAFTYKTPSEFELSDAIAVSGISGFPLAGFALDSQGDFYIRQAIAGRIAKLDHSGKAINQELDEEDSTAVAVEESSENALVQNLTSVGVFNAEGRELERLGQENGEAHLSEGAGIAVSDSAETIYVADAAAGQVLVFAPRLPGAPLIEAESLANVSSDGAELGGEVNPRSVAGEAVTEYHFEYGACASTCAESPYEASTPTGELPPDFEVHPVSVHIQGLGASTTYHFRLLAENSHGQATPGAEQTFTTEGAGGELALPDNRGWELVSPADKFGSLILPVWEVGLLQAAADGGAIAYQANAPSEGAVQGYSNLAPLLARRGAGAWSSRDIGIPHVGATGQSLGLGVESKFYDSELTLGAVQPFGEFNPGLSEEASESTAYLHELSPSCAGHCYRPLVTGKAPFANVAEGTVFGREERCLPKPGEKVSPVCGPIFAGATEDMSHVVLGAAAELKAGAGEEQLYEWVGGQLSQVSVLPEEGGAAPAGASLGRKSRSTRGAIAAEGRRIAWEAGLGEGQALYLRDMALEKTVQLDKAEEVEGVPCGGCQSGGGQFQLQSADGTRVLFTDENRLSEDSGAEKGHADLYECRILVREGAPACELTDLTPERGEEGAEVQEEVLGASADGSYVYFVAKGVLSEAPNARKEGAIRGEDNLYGSHEGAIGFIATLAEGDLRDWRNEGALRNQPTRVSLDGRFLELMSEARLSGYDNRDIETGEPAAEVYLYDATSGRLRCASCEPSGARPVGVEYRKLESGSGGLAGASGQSWPSAALVAGNVPGWQTMGVNQARYQSRYLSNEGRLFFNSADALVPQDTNATQDAYEYEPPAVGSCSEESASFSARSGGCVSLISSGSSGQESVFLDASESGDDVFFLTSAKLSPLDSDTARDIYDAHVCTSSLPCIVPSSVQSPPCSNEASCKASPTPQPSIFGAPSSASFQGPGNLAPAPAPKEETKAQKLAKALKACRAKKNKKKRHACERSARRRYGAKTATHKKKAKHKQKK
jgi:hypothetical protein